MDRWTPAQITEAAIAAHRDDPTGGPCTAVVYGTGRPELCGKPAASRLHVNPDDSRAIDHAYVSVGDRTYTDHYPSGKPYTACGMPHPTPATRGWVDEDVARRCSRRVEDGQHVGTKPDMHMNDRGNEWSWNR